MMVAMDRSWDEREGEVGAAGDQTDHKCSHVMHFHIYFTKEDSMDAFIQFQVNIIQLALIIPASVLLGIRARQVWC